MFVLCVCGVKCFAMSVMRIRKRWATGPIKPCEAITLAELECLCRLPPKLAKCQLSLRAAPFVPGPPDSKLALCARGQGIARRPTLQNMVRNLHFLCAFRSVRFPGEGTHGKWQLNVENRYHSHTKRSFLKCSKTHHRTTRFHVIATTPTRNVCFNK